jgi:transcriptional regulator with XRE-family HTH domain
MSLPRFDQETGLSALQLCMRIADRVRLERRRVGLNQQDFAARCEIPLRTYKRFELGQCDSLEAFVRIVMAFEKETGFGRIAGLELLFPPKGGVKEPRTPTAAMERLLQKANQKRSQTKD